jgi:hypothetical protein
LLSEAFVAFAIFAVKNEFTLGSSISLYAGENTWHSPLKKTPISPALAQARRAAQ